jgi:hypothetical protein
LTVDERLILKLIIKITLGIFTGDLFAPREGPLTGSCEHSNNCQARLEVLKVAIMKNTAFWNIKPCLCGLVVRVPGYRSRGPDSIPNATRFSEK